MAWGDVDLQHGVWHLPAAGAKNKRAAALPLTEPALAILRRRAGQRAGEPFVFPGTGKNGHVATVAKAWARVLARAGIPDLRLHDLRRSVGSWLPGGGASAFVIQRALTHASAASAKHYAHLDVAAVRAALAQVAEAMQAASKPEVAEG
jgi:integrase